MYLFGIFAMILIAPALSEPSYNLNCTFASTTRGIEEATKLACKAVREGERVLQNSAERDTFVEELKRELTRKIGTMMESRFQKMVVAQDERKMKEIVYQAEKRLSIMIDEKISEMGRRLTRIQQQEIGELRSDLKIKIKNNCKHCGDADNEDEANWGPWGPWSECLRCAPAEQMRERKCLTASGATTKDDKPCQKQRTWSAESRQCTNLPPCHPCKVRYMGKCFWLDFQKVNYTTAEGICRMQGSEPANIYDKAHFDALVTYVRDMMYPRYGLMGLWTGLEMDYITGNVSLSDGSPAKYVKWGKTLSLIGRNPLPESVNDQFARLMLHVDKFGEGPLHEYLGFTSVTKYPDGVLCRKDIIL